MASDRIVPTDVPRSSACCLGCYAGRTVAQQNILSAESRILSKTVCDVKYSFESSSQTVSFCFVDLSMKQCRRCGCTLLFLSGVDHLGERLFLRHRQERITTEPIINIQDRVARSIHGVPSNVEPLREAWGVPGLHGQAGTSPRSCPTHQER